MLLNFIQYIFRYTYNCTDTKAEGILFSCNRPFTGGDSRADRLPVVYTRGDCRGDLLHRRSPQPPTDDRRSNCRSDRFRRSSVQPYRRYRGHNQLKSFKKSNGFTPLAMTAGLIRTTTRRQTTSSIKMYPKNKKNINDTIKAIIPSCLD